MCFVIITLPDPSGLQRRPQTPRNRRSMMMLCARTREQRSPGKAPSKRHGRGRRQRRERIRVLRYAQPSPQRARDLSGRRLPASSATPAALGRRHLRGMILARNARCTSVIHRRRRLYNLWGDRQPPGRAGSRRRMRRRGATARRRCSTPAAYLTAALQLYPTSRLGIRRARARFAPPPRRAPRRRATSA